MNRPKRILVAVLNWGLGHATRCIPIIQKLQAAGAKVFLASDGNALQLLEKEFPKLYCYELPSYGIRYPSKNMIWNMALQSPKMMRAILVEQRAVSTFVKQHNINIIISDNRYGCIHANCHNIFMTHQINLIIPNPTLQMLINSINNKLINRFDECWVPDWAGEENISGKLSHCTDRYNLKFIGPLSRMKRAATNSISTEKIKNVIAVLSGPEPQRSYLEAQILAKAESLNDYKFLVVSGKVNAKQKTDLPAHIKHQPYLTSQALNDAIHKSDVIISRAGYSTIMDLVQLQKPAILVPTPGQTEQEYLAERFYKKKIFYTQNQDELDLRLALEEVQNYKGFHQLPVDETPLDNAINNLITTNRT